ncbi:MAG TPA: DnaJ domain-containing protein [Cytophagaceae bacterium]|nr:DnaJ domain-containing protein [Cytophagaceae bacterium]
MAVTLYDILGVPSVATADEIKTAYKKLAKQYHPDKNPGSTWHEEQFKRINQAYQILSDINQKRLYDYRLEYEQFLRQRPVNPRPGNTQYNTSQTYKKPSGNQTNTGQKRRPVPKSSSTTIFGKDLSEKKINFFVVGYYVMLLSILGFFAHYRAEFKIRKYFAEAARYEQAGSYYNAIELYNQVLSLDDENAEAYERIGSAKMKSQMHPANALVDFNRAIHLSDEPSADLMVKRARCYMMIHRDAQALEDLNYSLQQKELIDSAYFLRAEIYYHFHDYSAAISDYTSFIKVIPSSGESHMHRAYCFYQKKNYQAALYDYNFTIRWQPENGENYYYRAFTKFALRDSTNGCRDLHDSFLLGYNEANVAKTNICDRYKSLYQESFY